MWDYHDKTTPGCEHPGRSRSAGGVRMDPRSDRRNLAGWDRSAFGASLGGGAEVVTAALAMAGSLRRSLAGESPQPRQRREGKEQGGIGIRDPQVFLSQEAFP
jgi:hypothetical protein